MAYVSYENLQTYTTKMKSYVNGQIVKYTFTEDTANHTLTITGTDGTNKTIALGEDITSEKVINALGFTPANEDDIPDAVTEATVSGWGFTKNLGTYIKPESGIPLTDLSESVKTSLGKADSALQSFTETDPTVPSHVKNITASDIQNWNGKLDATDVPTSLSDLSDDSTHRLVTDSEKTSWSGKVDAVSGKSLISDTEIARLANVHNYDDTAVKGRVKALEDAGYITAADISGKADSATTLAGYGITNAYTKTEMDSALGNKLETSLKGVNNGLAELDANGKVPSSQLPSYVDDVIEGTLGGFPTTGETGKIYVDTSTDKTYRWSGTKYVEISASLALGETNSTAYAGSKGKANADAISALQTTVGALPTSYAPTNAQANVIETVKVNNVALTPSNKAVNVTVPTQPSDIGAMASTVTHLSGDVPTSRTVNGKALSSDITLTASDVGALPSTTSIPTVTDTYSSTSSNAMSGKAVASAISNNAVTESTVSGWGFTKNSGTYSKPSTGIPKTDLASAVQTSLGKADSALQSFTETDPTVQSWAKTGSGITVGVSVPSDAKFTDTTYSSKEASSGGTATSLVTTGEKYTWNNKMDKTTVLTGGSQTSTSSEDGGSNVYTFTKSDNTTSTLTVKNGSKGSKGDTGAAGHSPVVTATKSGTVTSIKVDGTEIAKVNDGTNGTTPTIKAADGANIGSVGTPSVTASTSGTTTTFTFNYLKGAKGDKGDPGQNATTTAVATTSANGLMSSTDKTRLNLLTAEVYSSTQPTDLNNNDQWVQPY